jgi:hypothetical protein
VLTVRRSGLLTVLLGVWLLTWHFRLPTRCRRRLRRQGRARARWCEGVGDALVGGISLPVDAVGVDLEQDRDAVPGAAGDLGHGHPEFSQIDTALREMPGDDHALDLVGALEDGEDPGGTGSFRRSAAFDTLWYSTDSARPSEMNPGFRPTRIRFRS